MINECWLIFVDVWFYVYGEQQLQQGIVIFFSIGDIVQIQFCCDFMQLCFIGREWVNFQMVLKCLLIGEIFCWLVFQYLLQQIVYFIDQVIYVIVWMILFQYGEFWIVMMFYFFIMEVVVQLEDWVVICCQQVFYVVFWIGYQVQVKFLRMVWVDEMGFEWE